MDDEATGAEQAAEAEVSAAEAAGQKAEQSAAGSAPEGSAEEEGHLDVPQEIQEKIDRRIGKEVAKRKAAEEALAETRTTLDDVQKRLQALEKDGKHAELATRAGLHPDYVTPEEAQVLERVEYLRSVRKFCQENWDGYEGSGTESNPSYSAQEVRNRFFQVDDELMSAIPKAESIRQRARNEMNEDIARGREAKVRKTKAGGPTAEPVSQRPVPPKIGGEAAGRTGKPAVSVRRPTDKQGFGASKLMEEGVTNDSLLGAYEEIA